MCFELLGLDVLLDETGKAYLLEVNHAPSFNTDTPFDLHVKSRILKDLFAIIDVTLEKRNFIIDRFKAKMEQRIALRAIKSLDPIDRESERKAYREKLLAHAKNHSGGFSLMYAGETNTAEPYPTFMAYAKKMHMIQTGVLSEKTAEKSQK